MKRLFLKAAGAAAAGALLKACGGGGGSGGSPPPVGSQTLLALLQQDGRFSTLLAAMQDAGLAGQLDQAGASQTLFAPTNDAYDRLESRAGALSAGKRAEFAGFHIVPEALSAASLRSLNGGRTPETLYSFRGNTAVLIFVTDNGPLNIWDGIGRTSITIPEPDIGASNGVLHVVSDVLVPRGVLTVLQILRASIDSFSDFSASVTDATSISALNGPGPVTVFVPGNDAVSGTLTTSVVRQHIIPSGEYGSNTFTTGGTSLTTLNGQVTLRKGTGSVLATLTSGSVQATVTDVDFFGSNGVINVIDRVLT